MPKKEEPRLCTSALAEDAAANMGCCASLISNSSYLSYSSRPAQSPGRWPLFVLNPPKFDVKKISILLMFFASCQSSGRFTSEKWKEQSSDPVFPNTYRKAMVDDLIKSDTLIGLDSAEVFRLLGPADYVGYGGCSYRVEVLYGADIDPMRQTLLDIRFSNGRVDSAFIPK
jgi:hypothetical protein